MREVFDILTIALAALALVACVDGILKCQRKSDRSLFALKLWCCVLLLICQSSWATASVAGLVESPDATNWLWDLFNSSVMITFMVSAWTKIHR